jgi:hypothetical protein
MQLALQTHFEVGGHKAYWIARLAKLYDVCLVSTLDPAFVERCGFRHVPVAEHQAWSDRLCAAARRIGFMPHSGHTLPIVRTH